jgi:glycosyltransferase involved in cell wall biosynthesis
LIARHQLPVTLTGFLNQSEIVSAYAASDCLTLPSDHGETWGLVVNEAMACGLPAIVSDQVGCGPDLVTPGETGAIFPFGDWSALAESLCRAAADPTELQRQGVAAEGYSPAVAAEGIRDAVIYAASSRRR